MTSPSKLGKLLKQIDKMTGGVKPKAWLFKFVPLVIIQACSVFAYTILKNTKNSIVTRVSPTTTFTWLKILVITPLALFFPAMLKKIIEILKDKREKIPYVLIGGFLGIYLLFALVIFPMGDALYFPWLVDYLPKIFKIVPEAILNGISHTFGYWGNSLFYGLAEFWSVVGINFLAWGIANDICNENETKIFYPSFGILSNIGGYFAATIMAGSKISGLKGQAFIGSVRNIIITASIAIALMGLTYFFIERFVIKNPEMMEAKKEAKKKAKPENGLQMVLKNAYLQKIAIMVVAYAIIIFLVEQCWYDSIIRAYGSAAYTPVTAEVAKINSLMTIGLSLFSTIVLTKVRWAVRAMVPVIMIGFSAVGFFIFYLLGRSADAAGFLASSGLMTVAPIQLAVILGSFQNVSSRCTKYSIFDSTKEQLFSSSPDSDVKLQGKGAVDVAFGRTAKGSGALIVLGLLSIHSAYVSLTRHFFGDKKAQTTIVSDTNTVNAQKGKAASEALMRDMVDVAIQKDGTYKITVKDFKDVQHPDFDKVVNSEGQVTFIQKVEQALDSGIQVNVDLNRVENTTKSEIPDIAPAIFVIVMVVVVLWSYAVITIAPMYEQNLLEARKAAGETDISEEAEEVNPFNKKTILQLTLIAGLLCTFLYVWVSHNITKAVAGIDKSIVDEAALKKMQSYD